MEYEGLGFDYKKLFKRKELFLFCLGILLLISSCFYFQQRYQNLESMKKISGAKRGELKRLQLFKTQHPDMEAYKKNLLKENEIIGSLLPEKYEEKEFLSSLHAFSQGIKIVNVTLPAKQNVTKLKNNVQIYYAKIQIQGDYFDVLRLFKELEAKHYALQNIKIKADKNGYLDASLSIGKYILENK